MENGVIPTVFRVGIVTVVFQGYLAATAVVVILVAASVVKFTATGIDVRFSEICIHNTVDSRLSYTLLSTIKYSTN